MVDDDLLKLQRFYKRVIENVTVDLSHADKDEIVKEAVRIEIFDRIKLCPICGAKMDAEDDLVKYCPMGDGKAYISESADGLPAIVFEVRSKGGWH